MKKIYLALIFPVLLVVSCENPLDETPYDKYGAEFVFGEPKKAEEYVMRNYNVFPYGTSDSYGFNRLESGMSMIACASDEAIPNIPGSNVDILTNGSWSPSSTNPDNQWDFNYQYIRSANIGLENLDMLPATSATLRKQLYGELIFIRAFAHFELIRRYGGIPLVTRTLTLDEDLNIPRNSFGECVNFVVSQCDTAVKYLLTPDAASGGQLGRISTGAAMALKSRMLLYAASDLYNGPSYAGSSGELTGYGSFTKERWETAAKAAADVIGLGYYALYKPNAMADSQNDATARSNGEKNYADLFYTLAGNKELVLIRTSAQGNAVEKKNLPVGYTNGQGTTNPSQQMVDAYGMLNGKSIADATSGYKATDPFTNRDPRFTVSIFYNDKAWTGNPSRTKVETFTDGLDNRTSSTNATKTGYYLSKFMKTGIVISGSETKTNHCFPLIRYAEVLLNYAEAMNEAYGPDVDPKGFGKTARTALVEVRARVLRPKDAVLAAVPSGDAAAMRDAIRNERRVELAFEDHRHMDVRRWKIASQTIGQNLSGMKITKSGTTFTYEVVTNVATRVFEPKMYLYPIPKSEMNKNKALIQNPLW
jgi:starch-binding outer membrane protein, SusD/RagB family